jgi:hypothetical protein
LQVLALFYCVSTVKILKNRPWTSFQQQLSQDVNFVKIALAQSKIVWNDISGNLSRAEKLADEAAENEARLIVFPEMFATGFTLAQGKDAEDAF